MSDTTNTANTNTHTNINPDLTQVYGKSIVIKYKKSFRKSNEVIIQHFTFKINVVEGVMKLWMQKDGQRSVLMKRESQINFITAPVLQKLFIFMGFKSSVIDKKTKKQLVSDLCNLFRIPTKDSLIISVEDTQNIIQNQIDIIEYDEIIDSICEYTYNNTSNVSAIADIIEMTRVEGVEIFNYIQCLWILLIDIFQLHKDDDFKYKTMFFQIVKTDNDIVRIKNELNDGITEILEQYNEENNLKITINAMWYGINLQIMRYFNCTIKNYVLSLNKIEIRSSPMNEQRKCSIYKYFGSSLCKKKKQYQGKNYGVNKSKDLVLILNKCLLNYDTNDYENGKSNENNDTISEYLKVPLRLRLQNRGNLDLITEEFYNNVAIKIYEKINGDLRRIFVCYDPKEVQAIAESIVSDQIIHKAFHSYIGDINVADPTNYKNKVLKDLSHSVTSRIVRSMIKRNQIKDLHVGQFRTAIKTLQSRKS